MPRATTVVLVLSLTIVALMAALSRTAEPQTPATPSSMPEPKSTIVPHIEANVKIDGVLDEAPWQKAARLTPFAGHQRRLVLHRGSHDTRGASGRHRSELERSRRALDGRGAHSLRRPERRHAKVRRRVAGQFLSLQSRPESGTGTTQLVADHL